MKILVFILYRFFICKYTFTFTLPYLYLEKLIYELHLDILKMCLHTKNKVSRSKLSKVRALQTDRHTDATEIITVRHSQMITNYRQKQPP